MYVLIQRSRTTVVGMDVLFFWLDPSRGSSRVDMLRTVGVVVYTTDCRGNTKICNKYKTLVHACGTSSPSLSPFPQAHTHSSSKTVLVK